MYELLAATRRKNQQEAYFEIAAKKDKLDVDCEFHRKKKMELEAKILEQV